MVVCHPPTRITLEGVRPDHIDCVYFRDGRMEKLEADVVIPASAREVIESAQLAHFITINRDGSPHVTIVWVGLEGGEIVIGKLCEDHQVATSAAIPASRSRSKRRPGTRWA